MSDYDRSKFYGKKKFTSQNKESSYARSYYGRRSPNSASKEPPKLKQPTILLKAREHTDEAVSPKKDLKDHDLTTLTITASTPTEPHPAPTVKTLPRSIKFLEDSILHVDNIQEYMQENVDFLVVGVVGPHGVGKSTIMNLIAHDSVTEELKRAIFKNNECPKEEEYGDNIKLLTDENQAKNEIFRIQTGEEIETNSHATRGIDLFVTSNRVILLDCQPCISVSVLDELVQSENKRSNLVNDFFMPPENSGEIQGLQLTAFLMSVCHVLIVVQDYFFDSNLIRFLQTAEMLKPTHSNTDEDLNDHFPHLLVMQNRAQMDDFSPRKFKLMQEYYNLLFQKTKLLKDSNLGLASSKLISYLNEESSEGFNLFLIPEYCLNDGVYSGHPNLEDLVRTLRANILGAIKNPLTHVQLTEKTWLVYCSKVWENVKKSSFFVEYTKLMP